MNACSGYECLLALSHQPVANAAAVTASAAGLILAVTRVPLPS